MSLHLIILLDCLSVCLSVTANDINREPTGAVGVETTREIMRERERESDGEGRGGESKLVLQYFSSSSSAAAAAEPQDSQNTAFSDIPTAVTIRWTVRLCRGLFVCFFLSFVLFSRKFCERTLWKLSLLIL